MFSIDFYQSLRVCDVKLHKVDNLRCFEGKSMAVIRTRTSNIDTLDNKQECIYGSHIGAGLP